ncbi:unnamed protein product, partial [Mesorhabditis spiculigera]
MTNAAEIQDKKAKNCSAIQSAGIRWCYHALSTIALLVEWLWIYVLQFRSPPEMKLYKWVLVKLAVGENGLVC